MGKHGPCHHCGVTSTPLWRNGPPEKPVLCNACGSRWRTKGTLTNYTPLHAREEHDEFEDYSTSKVKIISVKNKDNKVFKRKHVNDRGIPSEYNQGFRKSFDKDTSNRSSSGSAISYSESCAQYGSAYASDLTGSSQPVACDMMVPSKKRTCVARSKPSPVEKLTKDLYIIWNEQQWSSFSELSEENLLLESDKPMVSVEIGHGTVLIQHPSSIARKEESEDSSFSIHNKHHTVNSRRLSFPCLLDDTGVNSSTRGIDKIKKPANPGTELVQTKRDKDQLEKLQILAHHNSPLCYIDLQDIINFEKFVNHLTSEEQQHLLKFLPSNEALGSSYSLESMFDSPQLKENLSSFQGLLSQGIFDSSFSGFEIEDYRNFKKLILCNSKKSKWIEQYQNLKDFKGKNCAEASKVAVGSSAVIVDHSLSTKMLREGQHPKLSGLDSLLKSPIRIPIYDKKEQPDPDGSFFSPKCLFSSPSDYGSLMLNPCHFTDESCEQDLLLDVPSNGFFPQAELILPTSAFGAQATASSSSVYPNLLCP